MAKLRKEKGKYIVSGFTLPLHAEYEVETGDEIEVTITVVDKRHITEKQRNFIFALCDEFAYFQGDDKEYWRLLMQHYYSTLNGVEIESLKNASMTYANGLIDTIITFAIDNSIPIAKKILDENQYRFTEQQVYALTLKRQCAICGQRADIHHKTAVGMGHDRTKISHVGMEIIPLCRSHHTEAHTIGDEAFMKKYHLTTITVDDKLDYFIKKKKLRIYQGE